MNHSLDNISAITDAGGGGGGGPASSTVLNSTSNNTAQTSSLLQKKKKATSSFGNTSDEMDEAPKRSMADEFQRFNNLSQVLSTPSTVLTLQQEKGRRGRSSSGDGPLNATAGRGQSGSSSKKAPPTGKYPVTVPCDPKRVREHKELVQQLQKTEADPEMIDRMFHNRELRSRIANPADRFGPACHYNKLIHESQVGDEMDIANETNMVLDSKSNVADLLQKHRDGLDVRNGIEQSISEWSAKLVNEVQTIDTEQRTAEMDAEGDSSRKGEALVYGSIHDFEEGITGLSRFGAQLENVVHKAQMFSTQFGAGGGRIRTKTTGTLTTMSFFSGLAADGAGETEEEDQGLKVLNDGSSEAAAQQREQVDQIVALEAKIARRNESMINLMTALETKDRLMKRQKAELKTRIKMGEQENTQLRIYIDALQTGQGFTHLWDLEEEESDVARFLKEAMKQALIEAQEELKRSIMDDSEIEKNKKKMEKLDSDIPTPAQLKERAESRKQIRELKESVDSLKKECDIKDEMLQDREDSCKRFENENTTLANLVSIMKDDAGKNRDQLSTLTADVAEWKKKFEALEQKSFHDLEKLKEEHDSETEDLRKSVMEMRREVDRAEKGAENKVAIKSANIIQRNNELEDATRSLKELNRALESRSTELQNQLNESLSITASTTVNVVSSLRALRSQVQNFIAERDVDTLRQCTWRCTQDALQDVLSLCTGLSMFQSKEPSIVESLDKTQTMMAEAMVPSEEDDRRKRLEKDLQKMTELQQETMLKFKAMADEAEKQRENRKATMESVKEAVKKLVSKDGPEFDRTNDEEVNAQLREIFEDGFHALEASERERETVVLEAVQKSAEAQQTLVNLCDDTAEPIYALLSVLSTMCNLVRQTSGYMHTAIAKPVTEWLSTDPAMNEGSRMTIESILEEVGTVLPKKNNRLIVEAVQTRIKFKFRLESYQREISNATMQGIKTVEEAAKIAMLRRRMNHVERRMFAEHQRIYKEFIRIHQHRCDSLLKLDNYSRLRRTLSDTEKAIVKARRSPSTDSAFLEGLERKKRELEGHSPTPQSLSVGADDDDPTSKSPFSAMLSSRRGSRRTSMTTFLLHSTEEAPLSSRSRRSSMGRNSLSISPQGTEQQSPLLAGSSPGPPRGRRNTAGPDDKAGDVGSRRGSNSSLRNSMDLDPAFRSSGAFGDTSISITNTEEINEVTQRLNADHDKAMRRAKDEGKLVTKVYQTVFSTLVDELGGALPVAATGAHGPKGTKKPSPSSFSIESTSGSPHANKPSQAGDPIEALEANMTIASRTKAVDDALQRVKAFRDRVKTIFHHANGGGGGSVAVASVPPPLSSIGTKTDVSSSSPVQKSTTVLRKLPPALDRKGSSTLSSNSGAESTAHSTALAGGGSAAMLVDSIGERTTSIVTDTADAPAASTLTSGSLPKMDRRMSSSFAALRRKMSSTDNAQLQQSLQALQEKGDADAAAATKELQKQRDELENALVQAEKMIDAQQAEIDHVRHAFEELAEGKYQSDKLLETCRVQLRETLLAQANSGLVVTSPSSRAKNAALLGQTQKATSPKAAKLAEAQSGMNRHFDEKGVVRTDSAKISLASDMQSEHEKQLQEELAREVLLRRQSSLLDVLNARKEAVDKKLMNDTTQGGAAAAENDSDAHDGAHEQHDSSAQPHHKAYLPHKQPVPQYDYATVEEHITTSSDDEDDNDDALDANGVPFTEEERAMRRRERKKKRKQKALEELDWGLDGPPKAKIPSVSPLLEAMWKEHNNAIVPTNEIGVQTDELLLIDFIMQLIARSDPTSIPMPTAAEMAKQDADIEGTGAAASSKKKGVVVSGKRSSSAAAGRPSRLPRPGSSASTQTQVQQESIRVLPVPAALEQIGSAHNNRPLSMQYRDLRSTLSSFLAEGRKIDNLRRKMVSDEDTLSVDGDGGATPSSHKKVGSLRPPSSTMFPPHAHANGELTFSGPGSADLSLVNFPPVFHAPSTAFADGGNAHPDGDGTTTNEELFLPLTNDSRQHNEVIPVGPTAVNLYEPHRHQSDRQNAVNDMYLQMADFFRSEAQRRVAMTALIQRSYDEANAMDGHGKPLVGLQQSKKKRTVVGKKKRAASAGISNTVTGATTRTQYAEEDDAVVDNDTAPLAGESQLTAPTIRQTRVASAGVLPSATTSAGGNSKYLQRPPTPARESDVTRGIPPLLRTSIAIVDGMRPPNNNITDKQAQHKKDSQSTLGDGSVGIRPGSSAFSKKIRNAMTAEAGWSNSTDQVVTPVVPHDDMDDAPQWTSSPTKQEEQDAGEYPPTQQQQRRPESALSMPSVPGATAHGTRRSSSAMAKVLSSSAGATKLKSKAKTTSSSILSVPQATSLKLSRATTTPKVSSTFTSTRTRLMTPGDVARSQKEQKLQAHRKQQQQQGRASATPDPE